MFPFSSPVFSFGHLKSKHSLFTFLKAFPCVLKLNLLFAVLVAFSVHNLIIYWP